MAMREYRDPKITPFIPGRGRIMVVPRSEAPEVGEVVLVEFDGFLGGGTKLVEKRCVALELSTARSDVGVVLRDPDFPDPVIWDEWENT